MLQIAGPFIAELAENMKENPEVVLLFRTYYVDQLDRKSVV